MKFPFINNPNTNKPDEMVTVVMVTTIATIARFLVDGVSLKIQDFSISFGHIDAAIYIALLAPVLGVHGYIKGKDSKDGNPNQD